MEYNEEKKERVIIAGVHRGLLDRLSDTTKESLDELEELVKTAGGEVICTVVQNKSDLEAATYMGEGKLEELKNAAHTLEADMVVFDDELSPIQTRNISDFLELKVLDRSMLILDIFAMRAKSGEGKLQVELAQLKYRLPRLRGLGVEMSRTGAGIGTRGPGETRLESDRRHIRKRISSLEEEIREIKKRRGLIHTRRKKDGVITAALVGYTNAGKSTLLNTLTDADVFAENKLFATLDPTSRGLTLEDNRRILLVDTVGFIRKLPHHLVEAFKSTLEEAVVADILIHVIDASSEETDNQIKVVESVLRDIGAVGKPVIAVYNKCDKLTEEPVVKSDYSKTVFISAKHGTNINGLIEAISDTAPGKKRRINACIPYSEGKLVNELHDDQKVIHEEYGTNGTVMELMVDAAMYERIKQYVFEG
ncbi:MAG: GTPase HflX [Oscillospiraceae bacterium]|nr:GTPase HflX [Oscillospiraceae bacterium]